MLRIRLRRVGKKGHPSYRIVVADSRAPRDGAYVEWIGNYDPMAEPPAVTIKADRAQAWLSQGAQPSDAVARILDWNGILTRTPTQRNAGSKTAEEAPAEAAPAPAPAAAAPAAEPEAEETPAAAEDTSEETVAEVVAEEAVEEAAEEPTSEEESGDSAGDDAEETSEEESSE
ncbi:MAG: 30S ribosomal protein S16 [Dehalococcoidia bacterium]|nr:30S ribosomal protein S16 [Dehalococcoidia bacterium]